MEYGVLQLWNVYSGKYKIRALLTLIVSVTELQSIILMFDIALCRSILLVLVLL
jgi:hypothetical protein